MIHDFQLAIKSLLKVPKAIRTYKLLPYFLISGMISLVVGVVLIYGSISYGDDLGRKIAEWYPYERGSELISTTSAWAGRIFVLLTSVLLYKYIILILVSPLMSPLSLKMEQIDSGQFTTAPFSIKSFGKEIWRGVRISIRNLWKEMLFSLVVLLFGLIPGIGIISAPLLFVIQAYYAGFGSMDYYMERKYKVKEAVSYVRKHRVLAISIGSVFLGLIAIPFIGFLVAPGVCAIMASSAMIELHKT